MNELVLAVYLLELKSAFEEAISDPDLLELLYDGIADPLGLLNQNKQTISVSPAQASLIMNRKKYGNALKVIRKGAGKKEVKDSIEGYFKKKVAPRLHKEKIPDLVEHLRRIIELDREIAETKRAELLALADEKTLAKFLGFTYLYVVPRDNVRQEIRLKTAEEIEEYKKHPLKKIAVPDEVIEEEKKYTNALLSIYAQLENRTDFQESELSAFTTYNDHFAEQREYYYLAEAVRRGTRDVYKDEVQFAELKDETYEGVKEAWEDPYDTGMNRLRKVLREAAHTPVDRCWLSRDTDWIGNSQKKGVCHFLIKDGRLKGWVRDDDRKAVQQHP